jgi:hypothetical protein
MSVAYAALQSAGFRGTVGKIVRRNRHALDLETDSVLLSIAGILVINSICCALSLERRGCREVHGLRSCALGISQNILAFAESDVCLSLHFPAAACFRQAMPILPRFEHQ